jgi:hypothetical protein
MRSLCRVQRVAGAVVRLAHGLELRLHLAQLGQPRLQRVVCLFHRALDALFFLGGVAVLEEPELVLLQRLLVDQLAVGGGDLGLRLELLEVGVELAQDVLDPRQVLACVLEAVLGFAAALLVLGNAGGFLEEQAQLLGLALDDAADRALTDDRVGARTQAGAEEHVLHVTPTHRLVVDVVARRAVTREHALDRDLGERVPLAAGACVFVAEHQLDTGAAGRLALTRAVEDHVLHRLAAQLAGLALAEHPAHRVDDV